MLASGINAQEESRLVVNMNTNWRFSLSDDPRAKNTRYDDSKWKEVNIPHDWAIEQEFSHELPANTGKLPWKGVGWYRKSFTTHSGIVSGSRTYLIFDGIMSHPEVYINGKLAGSWDYGYNSFYLEISNLINPGKANQLAIRVDTRKTGSRWYPGAGIYRKVQMLHVHPVHFEIWGNQITTPDITEQYARIRVTDKILTNEMKDSGYTVVHGIYSPDHILILEDSTLLSSSKSNRSSETIEHWFTLPNPRLWSVESPVVYTMRAQIRYKGLTIDETYTPFGIRYFRFDPLAGFSLNGNRIQIKGVNLHHDHGPLGARFYTSAMYRQLKIMKEMGCNAIRTSHNPAAPELLAMCDTMGFLVFNEGFDKWNATAGLTEDMDFDEFMKRNIKNFMLRDRNHPSVIVWSMGNEMTDVQYNENEGLLKLQKVISFARENDVTRPVTIANDRAESAALRHFDYYDLHCWNYARRYAAAREVEPDKAVIISESASTLSTRGYYEIPLPAAPTDFSENLQVSSYDLNAPSWAEIADYDFLWQDLDRFVSGEFVWTGFDYLGEPTPYNDEAVQKGTLKKEQTARSSFFGIVDLCGIPKDRFWLYKSHWRPDDTIVHILPHWNWEGSNHSSIPVFVYTTGSCVELYLNGQSLGVKCKSPLDREDPKRRYRIWWDSVAYSPGEITAVAYRDGKILGTASVKTAGEFREMRLTADKKILSADGEDLTYILVEALDDKGNMCPLENSSIKVTVNGAGTLEGLCNGDPQSFEPFFGNSIQLFHGKAVIVVKSIKDVPGGIEVVTESEGVHPVLEKLESID